VVFSVKSFVLVRLPEKLSHVDCLMGLIDSYFAYCSPKCVCFFDEINKNKIYTTLILLKLIFFSYMQWQWKAVLC